jgi:hypothetical protein
VTATVTATVTAAATVTATDAATDTASETAEGPALRPGLRAYRPAGGTASAHFLAASLAFAALNSSSSAMFGGTSEYFENSMVNSALPWVPERSVVE